jgi:glycosyltransferase involved in cell wall biosynthesis
LKILWVCWSRILDSKFHLSGSERIERVSYLSQEGHQVYLVGGNFEKHKFHENSNLHLITIPLKYFPALSPILYGLVLFFFMPFFVTKIRPDFVITDVSATPFLIWKPFLSKFLKFKTVLDIRGTPVETERRHLTQFFFNMAIAVAKMFFDGMTIVTPMMKDQVSRVYGIRSKWIDVLPNGISNDFINYQYNITRLKKLKGELGFEGKFVLIYHGSFRLNGGLFESFEAINLLKKDYPDIVLFLLGTSTPNVIQALNEAIEVNNLKNNIILHGPVDFHSVPDFIAMSDVGFVSLPNIPAWRFQQPLKMLEYMSLGKAIIAVDSPAHRCVAGPNSHIIYVPEMTPKRLAESILFAYRNKEKLENWGNEGKTVVINNFIWEKVNKEFIKFLRSL